MDALATLAVGMTPPTIFWMTVNEADRPALEDARSAYGAKVVRMKVSRSSGGTCWPPSREAGPPSASWAWIAKPEQVLGLGVDEVLRAGEVTREALENAIARANARAAVRASPEYRHALLDQDEETAFAQLGDAFGERLETPLAMASVDCASVTEAINCMIEVDDQFVAWTALVAPSEQLRTLVARRLTGPTAPELRGVLTRLRASIGRAESLVRLLRDLTKSESTARAVDVSQLLAEVVDVMRPMIDPWAEIASPRRPGVRHHGLARATVVVVGTASSWQARWTPSARLHDARGNIAVRVFEEEDAVILEIRDDGREIPSDLRPHLPEQHFTDSSVPRRGLLGLRDRVLRAGGDLLVDSQPGGSTVRVFIPSAKLHEAVVAAPAADSAGDRVPAWAPKKLDSADAASTIEPRRTRHRDPDLRAGLRRAPPSGSRSTSPERPDWVAPSPVRGLSRSGPVNQAPGPNRQGRKPRSLNSPKRTL